MGKASHGVKVWDPLVRIFHWTLVAAFAVAYFTDDEDLLFPHVWAGYVVIGLLLFRLIWGFAGTTHARFSDFLYAPAAVMSYLRHTYQGKAKRYLGHNPAGGWMVLLLLLMLALISITGLFLYGADGHGGPMAGVMAGTGKDTEELLEDLHEFFANLAVFLVMIHIAGVVVSGVLHQENLVRAMVTGYKRAEGSERAAGHAGAKPSAYHFKSVLFVIGLGMVVLGAMGGATSAKAAPPEGGNAQESDALIPLEQLIDKGEAMHPGKLIEAEENDFNGQKVYEIETLDEAGKVWEMYFDAKTGELVTQEEEEKKGADTGH
jgi:cytochrome b